jgi:predicted dehydrogenase
MAISDIRAAVVGVGFIGVAHVEALRRLGVDVRGVVGSSPDRARAKAVAAGLPPAYESLDALLSDPEVDAVHVASPNHLHAHQVRAVLAAGKHVICEKPLALNPTETTDLVERAAATRLVNAVCFNLRFYPLCHQMQAMVASGQIGAPRFVTGSYLQDWLLLDTDWNWRLVPEEAGELRSVADIGSHWLDLSRFITGRKVVEVMSELHTFVPIRRHLSGPIQTFSATRPEDRDLPDRQLIEEEMSSDDGASIMLRYEDGTRGLVAISQVAAGRKNTVSIEVDGAEAALSWMSEDPDRLWIGHRGRPNEILQRDPSLVDESVRPIVGYPGGHVEGYPDTFRALFREVYRHIDSSAAGPPTYPTLADGHDAVCVTEAVAASHQRQSWVKVER